MAWLERGESSRFLIRSARFGVHPRRKKEAVLMLVTIGVDPHKGSHTAVAIDGEETKLSEVRIRSAQSTS